jgi:1-phosphofructokinase
MIYTLTLNPSIDYVVKIERFQQGALNRAEEDFKLPGGKGINVSRILKRMTIESTALGFLGGFTGDFIRKWLDKEHITNDFIQINDESRINIKLKSDTETEINGCSPGLSKSEIQELLNQLANLKKGDIVVLSGSTPTCLEDDFYLKLIKLIKSQGADFAIDTTGKVLTKALVHQPLLIKPNIDELADLFKLTETPKRIDDVIPYGLQLLNLGAQNVIISMGGNGALFFNNEGIYQSNVLDGTLMNSVGAGDSMIAGFIGHFSTSKNSLEAFKWGVASGSATAFSNDLASNEFITELFPNVLIGKL